MDQLVGIDMHESTNGACAKCGMKKQRGCCKDESKQIKVADEHKPAPEFVFNVPAVEHADQVCLIQCSTSVSLNDLYVQPSKNSPLIGVHRYIYLRVFRI